MSVFDNETAVVNGLKTGQIDSAVLQDANQELAISSDSTLKKTTFAFDFQGLLLFDRAGVRTPALRRPEVRQAINHALDRRTMTDKIRQGRGEITDQVFGHGRRRTTSAWTGTTRTTPRRRSACLPRRDTPRGSR